MSWTLRLCTEKRYFPAARHIFFVAARPQSTFGCSVDSCSVQNIDNSTVPDDAFLVGCRLTPHPLTSSHLLPLS